jgi:hypothetical protein
MWVSGIKRTNLKPSQKEKFIKNSYVYLNMRNTKILHCSAYLEFVLGKETSLGDINKVCKCIADATNNDVVWSARIIKQSTGNKHS